MGLERWHALICGLVLLALWEDTVHLVLNLIPSKARHWIFPPYRLYYLPQWAGANAGLWVWITFVTELDMIEDHFKYLTFDIILVYSVMDEHLRYLTLNLSFDMLMKFENP